MSNSKLSESVTPKEMMDDDDEFINLDNIPPSFHTKTEEDNGTAFTDAIPQTCMQSEESTNTIDFTGENTHFMTIENMMDTRYKEFNKALTDLACLVDTFSADKKTIKYIKNEYLKTYLKYFDVVKHIYNLDIADETIVPGTNADRIIFKREVVEPKRVKLDNGKKLHIYTDKDGKYQFIDEMYANGNGISIQDLAFWIENRDQFTDSCTYVENTPAVLGIFGKTAYIPIKGLRIPRNGNIMADRFYAILGRLHKQIGDLLMERKKTLAKKGHAHSSDDEYLDEDIIEDN